MSVEVTGLVADAAEELEQRGEIGSVETDRREDLVERRGASSSHPTASRCDGRERGPAVVGMRPSDHLAVVSSFTV